MTKIGVTFGDPCGISAEIIGKSISATEGEGIEYVLFAGTDVIPHDGIRGALKAISSSYLKGRYSPETAGFQIKSLISALSSVQNGEVDALVTAPINKQAFVDQGYKIQGQTEFLAAACGCREVAMMFIGSRLKVGLVTTHLALRDIPFTITTELIVSKTFLVHIFLKKFFNLDSPQIAVCSLNPHAGEGGKLGGEDITIVSPAIVKLQGKGVCATGPHSADTVFHQLLSGRFDAVMALYHDQGLAPFKIIHFEEGVNVSVGLPFIRTSPDHGVAYDIAGRGQANPASMISAIKLAQQLVTVKKRSG